VELHLRDVIERRRGRCHPRLLRGLPAPSLTSCDSCTLVASTGGTCSAIQAGS